MPLKLFGKPKQAGPTPQQSIEKLKETLVMLEKREDYLQKKAINELKFAKQNASSNKRAAMMALKRKKAYESQIEKLGGARLTIEQQLMTIEGASVSLEAMKAMRMGARTMQIIHNHMTVDQVDDTMDEIREQMEVANEITDAIAQPLGGELYDEAELEDELAALEGELMAEKFETVSPIPAQPLKPKATESPYNFPAVPTTALVDDDDKELEAFSSEMMQF